jgi:hypothetical protein
MMEEEHATVSTSSPPRSDGSRNEKWSSSSMDLKSMNLDQQIQE